MVNNGNNQIGSKHSILVFSTFLENQPIPHHKFYFSIIPNMLVVNFGWIPDLPRNPTLSGHF